MGNEMLEYLTVFVKYQLIFICAPLFFVALLAGRLYKKYKKTVFLSLVGSLLFGICWNMLATKKKLWWYTEKPVIGIWDAYHFLPLEAYMFNVLLPLLIVGVTLFIRSRNVKRIDFSDEDRRRRG